MKFIIRLFVDLHIIEISYHEHFFHPNQPLLELQIVVSGVYMLHIDLQWHSLTREEQAKYYEKARQERQLHMQLYPGWSARDNYGYGAKKKKRKKERSADPGGTLSSSARTAVSQGTCYRRDVLKIPRSELKGKKQKQKSRN